MKKLHEESIGRWISLLHRYGNVYLNEKLKDHQLGAGQYQFLTVLYQNEGISQDDLASMLNMDKGTTARAIAKLEKEGYVERKVFEVDKRIKKLYLTEKAHSFEPTLTAILTGWKDILSLDLSSEEIEQTLSLLNKMAVNAEHHVKEIK